MVYKPCTGRASSRCQPWTGQRQRPRSQAILNIARAPLGKDVTCRAETLKILSTPACEYR
jgi:hypothetical protein